VHYVRTKRGKKKLELKYAKVKNISNNPKENYVEGYLVSSGDFGRKKHMHWIINMPDKGKPINIDEVIKDYQNDENRDERANLFKILKKPKGKYGVPCFFIKNDKNEVIAIGHTGMFRIPYQKTIGDHVPSQLRGDDSVNITDIAEAIFGKEAKFASRVFFEDAEFLPGQSDVLMKEVSPKILASPKPTTFQHYLVQDEQAINDPGKLNHWNSDANIRGYKLFWHRWNKNNTDIYVAETLSLNFKDFQNFFKKKGINIINVVKDLRFIGISENNNKIDIKIPFSEIPDANFKSLLKEYLLASEKSQYTVIKPIRPGVKFKGRIRFENLSEVELGALLFALDLPESCYHKLGMGKPLGLGSVKITPGVFISDRNKRYTKLFSGNKWELAEKKERPDAYKKKFECYVLGKLSNGERGQAKTLWETERLKQLKAMLDWTNTEKIGWLEKTKYMEIERRKNGKKVNEFKNRPVLPKPENII